MENLCAYCFKPEKNCNHHCKGEDCKDYWVCSKRPKPTVRITTKCTQKCKHCCFECSPECDDMMTADVAENIGNFLFNNNIHSVNIMGGEFYCNPDWKNVCNNLIDNNNFEYVRIVTNSDWAGNDKVVESVIQFCKEHPNVYMALSLDKWHTNKYVERAIEILKENEIKYKLGKGENNDPNSIIPVGRGMWEYGFYASFSAYCSNPEHSSAFMIDEVGTIYKCQMGVWDFDKIDDFLEGGFAERFKDFYKTFDSVFIGNCKSCVQGYYRYGCKNKKKKILAGLM